MRKNTDLDVSKILKTPRSKAIFNMLHIWFLHMHMVYISKYYIRFI